MTEPEVLFSLIGFPEPAQNPWGKVWIIPCIFPDFKGTVIGIDPGRNYGVTIIHETFVTILGGSFAKQETEEIYGEMAYDMMQDIAMPHDKLAYVEGPSYGSPYHQAGLAHIRMGFYLGLKHRGIETKLVAPKTVRKNVFGSGKIKASEVWSNINPNAADSLAIALYAGGFQYEIGESK